MPSEREFDFYTPKGVLTLHLFCAEAKVIGRLDGEVNRSGHAVLNPAQVTRAPLEARHEIDPQPFEAETIDLVLKAASDWVRSNVGTIEALNERGCEPNRP